MLSKRFDKDIFFIYFDMHFSGILRDSRMKNDSYILLKVNFDSRYQQMRRLTIKRTNTIWSMFRDDCVIITLQMGY